MTDSDANAINEKAHRFLPSVELVYQLAVDSALRKVEDITEAKNRFENLYRQESKNNNELMKLIESIPLSEEINIIDSGTGYPLDEVKSWIEDHKLIELTLGNSSKKILEKLDKLLEERNHSQQIYSSLQQAYRLALNELNTIREDHTRLKEYAEDRIEQLIESETIFKNLVDVNSVEIKTLNLLCDRLKKENVQLKKKLARRK